MVPPVEEGALDTAVSVNSNSESKNNNSACTDKSSDAEGNDVEKDNENNGDNSDDGEKIDVKFVFSNRDGLHVKTSLRLSDTVAEVKGILMSIWPTDALGDVPEDGGRIRMICMGKGMLVPDTRPLSDFDLPIFKFPTPINISVKPFNIIVKETPSLKSKVMNSTSSYQQAQVADGDGCCCIIS